MNDIAILLVDRPGALAELGEALGGAGVSVEGGGVFVYGGLGVAHYLVDDAAGAVAALERAGIGVAEVAPVVTLRLRQDEPGQLGKIARRMADAGVNLRVQYSDHANHLVLVVDDVERARRVADEWTAGSGE